MHLREDIGVTLSNIVSGFRIGQIGIEIKSREIIIINRIEVRKISRSRLCSNTEFSSRFNVDNNIIAFLIAGTPSGRHNS